MTQKEITLNGQQVEMIYCAATENGFETISGKSIEVFVPTFGEDADGNTIITEPAKCTMGDFVMLAVAAIIAAYTRRKEKVPVTDEYILYDATPDERNALITTIVELRREWYKVPDVVNDTLKKEAEKGDNKKTGKRKNA